MVKDAKNQDAYLDYGASPLQNKGCEQCLVPEQLWAAVHCRLMSPPLCFSLDMFQSSRGGGRQQQSYCINSSANVEVLHNYKY